MIFLELFLTCFKVGLFTIGGGAAIIPILQQEVVAKGWIDMEQVTTYIAISESTPGPIAINMATFIGSSQAGFLGALCSTLGMVMPSFIIILVVAALIKNLLKYPPVKTFIASMRPALGGLILSVAVTMTLAVFFGIHTVENISLSFDWRTLAVLAVVIAIPLVWKRFKKKDFSSILLVVISGVLGMVLFGF